MGRVETDVGALGRRLKPGKKEKRHSREGGNPVKNKSRRAILYSATECTMCAVRVRARYYKRFAFLSVNFA